MLSLTSVMRAPTVPQLPSEMIRPPMPGNQLLGSAVMDRLPHESKVVADACMFAISNNAVAEYPVSNNPEVWLQMRDYVRHSPTLKRQLSLLRANGWSCMWNQGQGSRCEPTSKTMHIDLSTGMNIAVQHLAHETSHVFDTQVAMSQYANENDFLRAIMHNEARAVISHLIVREEMLRHGGVDIGVMYEYPEYYAAALNFYGRHHSYERLLDHVASMYLCQTSSLENLSYWHTYGNLYRQFWGRPPLPVSPQGVALAQANAWHRLDREIRGS